MCVLVLCSVDFVRALLFAFSVPGEEVEPFVLKLSQGKHGMSLVFVHHKDALESRHRVHIKLADHANVSGCCVDCHGCVHVVMVNTCC